MSVTGNTCLLDFVKFHQINGNLQVHNIVQSLNLIIYNSSYVISLHYCTLADS